ncbi:NADH-ubiquinone/plastoquinone oxidoreductase chain 4L family protein [Orientia chuto str. Dubai]|uniref:NADH-quinone oxidoreductase subunit K n=1 Tax=Orientia chuto str. Dubai TaxID=1359168 RepID=A0A0F3MKC5_9RICK|nr:NADH-quinone oxidoreductase subunit NuoK [Candidatus Orientia mediorientalis]KJV55927.1 NADH-ubiquinone/plastoquinone oxidoreductase chain 4L family protein [Orientia chuto str. Dubai]
MIPIVIKEIGLIHYLIFTTIMFGIGLIGVMRNWCNVIFTLMSIELMLLAVNVNFVVFSSYYNNIVGQIFSIMIFAVAAAESAIGLAIIVVHFRNSSIVIKDLNRLKG